MTPENIGSELRGDMRDAAKLVLPQQNAKNVCD